MRLISVCALIRIPRVWYLCGRYNKLATRMAHGALREFDALKESIEDFRERFDLYCLANKISGEGEAARRKQALFLTLLGQSAFAKLKTLASPTSVSELTLDQIMEHLISHRPSKLLRGLSFSRGINLAANPQQIS